MKKIFLISVVFFSCAFIPSNNMPLGLTAYWKFSEGAGNILINSATNTAGTNGINNGATWSASPFGNCLNFVRTSSQYVAVTKSPFNIQTAAPLTLSAWVKTSNANLTTIMADWNITVTGGWEFTINEFSAGKFDMLFTDLAGGNYFGRRGSTTVTDGIWRHLVMTYNGSGANTGINLYVNGVLETMTNLTAGSANPGLFTNTDFRIGARKLGGAQNQYFDGSIARPMVFNRELKPSEVWQLYADGLNNINNIQ